MAKSNIQIFASKISNIEQVNRAKSYIGKKVFSKSGEKVGKIFDVVLQNGLLAGVLVKGHVKLLISKEFFHSDSPETIMLSINPSALLLKKHVFDADARKLGKVVAISRKGTTNDFSKITVKKNIFSKPFDIPKSEIEIAEDNIILYKVY
jgi:sporulation protein YlmC with PRC-barrel domain